MLIDCRWPRRTHNVPTPHRVSERSWLDPNTSSRFGAVIYTNDRQAGSAIHYTRASYTVLVLAVISANTIMAIRNKSNLYSRSQFDLRDWFEQSHSSLTDHLCYVPRFHSSAKREVSTAYARHEYESVKPSSRYRRISLSVDSMPRRYDSKRARATPDEPEMTSQIIWLICVGCPTIYDRPYSGIRFPTNPNS
nr:hypothetical protein CFP56_02941 [Quercus suber]